MQGLPLRRRLAATFAGALAVGLALVAGPVEAAEPTLAPGQQPDPRIFGGTAVQNCGWPTTVHLSFGGFVCTGTLIHPEIVVTAGHCPSSVEGRATAIGFGEAPGAFSRVVDATCFSSPTYNGSVGPTDFGYCRLAAPVEDVPIVPPAWGCDLSVLTPGREVVIVGFGQSDNGGSGTKREVTTNIVAIGESAVIGGDGKDACFGDSGGPVYVKLDSEFGGDDTWRAFGITSGGGECGNGGTFALMHVAIPWIEDHSGIDVTPCQDREGNWEPSPACGAIPFDPANGAGLSWANGCSEGPTSGFGGLCGDPFGSGEDGDAPTVRIVDPGQASSFDLPAGEEFVDVEIAVEAEDVGFGVADVRLLVDGQAFDGNVDSSEPYSWQLRFPPGGFVLEAVARDWSGNEGRSQPVAIGIGEDPPALPEPGDNDESDVGFGIDEGEGCACASGPGGAGGPAALALGLVVLVGLRRRS